MKQKSTEIVVVADFSEMINKRVVLDDGCKLLGIQNLILKNTLQCLIRSLVELIDSRHLANR